MFFKKKNKGSSLKVKIKKSGFFDEKFYVRKYKDVKKTKYSPIDHYINIGIKEDRFPNEWFDPVWYRLNNKDVETDGGYPLLHYIIFGQYEKRKTNGHSNEEESIVQNINDIESNTILSCVDEAVYVNENIIFITGWTKFPNSTEQVKLSSSKYKLEIFTIPRDDLSCMKCGFYGFVYIDKKLDTDTYELTLSIDNPKLVQNIHITPKIQKDIKKVSATILKQVDIKEGFRELFENLYGEMLDKIWSDYYNGIENIETVKEYGTIPKSPEVSIIVPLYGRIDFMEYQTTIFATDDWFKGNVELIYVLDDPERFYNAIDNVSEDLFNLHNVPFKVVKYTNNLGYARANNVGVKYASSQKILLLNSDVFSLQKGWEKNLIDIFDSLENPGILGCKLLYEDNAIQHAGMKFKKDKFLDNLWTNIHPYKGMPDFDTNEFTKSVPAVTGACMLLKKSDYLSVGGLSENYVLGDFEDSDLCLKLQMEGKNIYYTNKVSLYHLERQSQSMFDDQNWKFKITIFNAWQHTKKWDSTIEKLMEKYDG